MSSAVEGFRAFVEDLEREIELAVPGHPTGLLRAVLRAAKTALKAAEQEDSNQEYRDWESRMGDDL